MLIFICSIVLAILGLVGFGGGKTLVHKIVCAEVIALAGIMSMLSNNSPNTLFILILASVGELYILLFLILSDKLARVDD